MTNNKLIANLPDEEWRPIPGREGYYEVSNLGRVRSITVMRPAPNPQGYLTVNFTGGSRTIHSLVAEAFIGPRPEGNFVRHLDGTRLNNNASNLAYGTPQDNVDDMMALGTNQHGSTHWNARLDDGVVAEIRAMAASGVPQHEIARHFDVANSVVSTIARGKAWTHLRGRDHPLACDSRPGEEWKPVPGFEGRYDVSNQGRIRSYVGKGRHGRGVSTEPQRIMRPRVNTNGYQVATLSRENSHHSWTVHRVVALAFHGEPPAGADVVRHLNGDRTDNNASNLAWGTPKANALDRRTHGTEVCGSKHYNTSLSEDDVRRIRAAYTTGALAEDLAAMYDVSSQAIRRICHGRSWKHVDGPITVSNTLPALPDAPSAKLTWEEVWQIKDNLAAGVGGSLLARMFHVQKTTISQIKLGKTWRDAN